ncbi:MAG: hypothetical protein HS117_03050 [Verrucomicrobiaceae bacterium]|nr:hypothetical protein [Verrucomicrobiaceae bacterium]
MRHSLPSALLLLLSLSAGAQTVTTRTDTVGKLLNEWFAAGTSDGLHGITYENRDGQHSLFSTLAWPQLKGVITPENDRGPARAIRDHPVIGNCSMASTPEQVGSLARLYMAEPGGGLFLARQYFSNNLFIYPEHLDHDPGQGGVGGGYGDLFPLNTPALLISQGSSFSDQPFLEALFATTAAFRPETRRVLLEHKLLAPTLQAILRRCGRMVASDADYLTGKAHPVVFDGTQIDQEKMVRMAHDMTPDAIPPVAVVEVLEETRLENGVHFFEPATAQAMPWQISSSPVSIGRVFRGNVSQHGMVVSVAKSSSVAKRKVGVRYAVLQGDPRFVSIEQQPGAPVARIRVRWHPPMTGARGIRSHRIDIGVFATHDGTTYGAPAIISFYMLPNEMHFYDAEGRVSEIHYQTFNPESGLPHDARDLRWARILHFISTGDAPAVLEPLFASTITPAEREAVRRLHQDIQGRLESTAALARDPAKKDEADKRRSTALDSLASALDTVLPGEKTRTPRQIISTAIEAVIGDPLFYIRQQSEISPLAARSSKTTAAADVRAEIHRLTLLGILRQDTNGTVLTVTSPKDLSLGEKVALRGLNLTVLSQVLMPDMLERAPGPAWVPPRLTSVKPWRDVMRYDAANGQLTGWTRHHDARHTEFDAQGRLLPPGGKGDPVPVTYVIDPNGRLTWRGSGK